jgi:hypothetical protein
MRQPLSQYDDRDEGFSLVGEERDDDALPPRDRRLPKLLLTAGAMAVFAGGLWFAYVQGTHHAGSTTMAQNGGVPVLRADPSPAKVKPEEPGGMVVPNQNVSLYNDKPGFTPVERLLPAAEKPMPRPLAPPPSAALPQPIAPGLEAAMPPVPPAPAMAPPPPAPPVLAVTPPSTPAETTAAAKPPEKPVTKPKPAPERQVAAAHAPARAEPHPARSGPVQVRLGSLRSPAAARQEWARLKRENPDLLGRLRAVAVRTDLGEKGIYYRIEAGPFSDTAAAQRLCNELKQRNFGCLLAR